MSARNYLNNNPAVVTIIAIVVLLVCLAVIWSQLGGGRGYSPITEIYFYDLNTGELFIAEATAVAPIEAPSGDFNGLPAGVRAHVYACDDCGDESDREVAFLQMTPMEVKQRVEQARASGNEDQMYEAEMVMETASLVRAPDGTNWVPMLGEEGNEIMSRVGNMCVDGWPKPCFPGR